MTSSVTASQLKQTFETLTVNKETLISIVSNTETLEAATNIVSTMVSGFYFEDLKTMLNEVLQAVETLNSKFPVLVTESVRYCGDMEILEAKEIDFINDKVTKTSHNSVVEEDMTEQDFDLYTTWLSELKKIMK